MRFLFGLSVLMPLLAYSIVRVSCVSQVASLLQLRKDGNQTYFLVPSAFGRDMILEVILIYLLALVQLGVDLRIQMVFKLSAQKNRLISPCMYHHLVIDK